MSKISTFSVRAISDLVVVREPERFVRLHIRLNGVAETILCPHDFDRLIEDLNTCSVGAEAIAIRGKHATQMERLGLIRKNARLSWNPTKLLREHATVLIAAFRDRWYKILDSMKTDSDT